MSQMVEECAHAIRAPDFANLKLHLMSKRFVN
jgi:hypothetical protein